MVVVKNLGKRYGKFVALQGVSFTVERGEVVTLLGPNGAGKTTLMRLLTGVLLPTEGKVLIDGYPMDTEPLIAKRYLGYLPEQTPFYPELTVTEYLKFAAEAKGVPREKVARKVQEVMHTCDIEGFNRKRLLTLSKGTLRRVGIAQAIVNDPSVLVLDEPTSGLDPAQALSFRQLILQLKKNAAIIISTHLMPDAASLSDRVLFIDRGKILLEDSLEGLKRRFADQRVFRVRINTKGRGTEDQLRSLLLSQQGIEAIPALYQLETSVWEVSILVTPEGNPAEALFTLLSERGWELIELQQKTVELEEVFRQLTLKE